MTTAEDRSKPQMTAAETRRLERAAARFGYFDPEENLCHDAPGSGRCPGEINDAMMAAYRQNIVTVATGGMVSKALAMADNVNLMLMMSACDPACQSGGCVTKIDPEDPWAHPAWRWRAWCQDQKRVVSNPAVLAVMNASVVGTGPVSRSVRRKANTAILRGPGPQPFLLDSPSAPPAATETDEKPFNPAWLLLPAGLIFLLARGKK